MASTLDLFADEPEASNPSIPNLKTPWGETFVPPKVISDAPRAYFKALLDWKVVVLDTEGLEAKYSPWQASLWREEYQKLRPGEKLPKKENGKFHNEVHRINEKRWEEMTAEFKALAESFVQEWLKVKDALDEELNRVAKLIEVKAGGTEYLYKSYYYGTYSSSDGGSGKYAQCQAKLTLAELEPFKVEARIEEKARESLVWVKVAEALDAEILRRSAYLSMRDWVRLCWKFGCQPRVFNPYLPHDFEAKNGLDYFGNEVPK